LERKLLDKDHFIMHFMPVAMNNKDKDHFPRYRVSTFKRTIKAPTEGTQEEQDFNDYVDLTVTSVGEPVIGHIVNSERLQPFFDVILEFAAKKTFGDQMKKVEIGPSAQTIHLLKTYTESKIVDVNWLIQVPDVNVAQDILIKLMKMIEGKLDACAKEHEYPVLTIYARFLKGLYYEPGKGGIATTAVDHDGHYILSFELLTYPPLNKKEGFKAIQKDIIAFLNDNHFKFKYHPGKTWPDGLNSLTDVFKDKIDLQKLANFQNAVIEMHGGIENIPFSTLLTRQNKKFIGLDTREPHAVVEDAHDAAKAPKFTPKAIKNTPKETKRTPKVSTTQRNQTLDAIVQLSKDLGHPEDHLTERLNKVKELSKPKKKAEVVKSID
jgi:hypothetical protein